MDQETLSEMKSSLSAAAEFSAWMGVSMILLGMCAGIAFRVFNWVLAL